MKGIKKISKITAVAFGVLALAGCEVTTKKSSNPDETSATTTVAQTTTAQATTTAVQTTTVAPTTTVTTTTAVPTTTTVAQTTTTAAPTTTIITTTVAQTTTAIKTTTVAPTTTTAKPTTTVAPTTTTAKPTTTVAPTTTTAKPTTTVAPTTTTAKPTTTAAPTTTNPVTTTSIPAVTNGITIQSAEGYAEGAYVTWKVSSGAKNTDYNVYYKSASSSTYTKIDTELIRIDGTTARADIVGLKKDVYQIKVESASNTSTYSVTEGLSVLELDRSGYAHYNYTSGVGAYDDKGNLKSNAQVIYVTNETKNTVTAKMGGTTYTGLVSILQNQSKSSTPLDIRIIGSIKTNQWKAKDDEPRLTDNSNLQETTFFVNDYETTYGENLVGLKSTIMDKYAQKAYNYTTTKTGISAGSTSSSSKKTTTYSGTKYSSITGKTVYDDDSANNMLNVSSASNVTIEGIGTDAEFFQFGLNWSACNSIEVKNITFTSYPEDACSFQGSTSNKSFTSNNIWVHNNVFNRGKNNWDVSGERDKPYGDGAFDLSTVKGVTLSYNKFNNCKKTGLVGGSDTMLNMNISFHHNYYNQVGSRLPLGRQANMHIYNNYYYGCSTAQDIRANAFVLSESNYFESCTNPQKVTKNDTYTGTVIKSYNDYLTGCGSSAATVVSKRTDTLTGNCKPDGSTNMTNFDTNSSVFYYDETNKSSAVNNLFTPAEAKEYAIKNAGPLGGGITKYYVDPADNNDPVDDPVDNPSDEGWTTLYSNDFNSSETISTTASKNKLYYTTATTKADSTSDGKTVAAKVSGGKLVLDDQSATDTVYVKYDFNDDINSGSLRISATLTLSTQNTKWSVLSLIDGNKNLAIRTDASKQLAVSYDGGTTYTALQSSPYLTSSEYEVVITIDFDSNAITVSLDGVSKTITGYTLTKFSGIQFMTASDARSLTVDNLKIETK